jgi:putative membrane protein
MNTRGIASLPLLAAALLASAAPTLAQSAGGGKSAPLTDAHIAAIVVGANTIDIEYGKLAQKRARNAEVRQFAAMMISAHTAVNEQAGALAARLRLTPEASETSRQLAAAAEAKRAELGGRSGADFDRAYIANEVAFHQVVLDAIDKALIPNAKNAELKSLIEKVRPAIVGHLEHAKRLQADLGHR